MRSSRKPWAVFVLLWLTTISSAQDTAAARRNAREQWFLHGRTAPGALSARRRAFQLRAQSRSLSFATSIRTSDGWKSVGPLPLVSDPTGMGQQDYGWIAGRVTSIAIDPNEQTGNTVYAGAANGGVWRSTNAASPDPSTVQWTPLSDDQETLAIGAIAVQPKPPNSLAGTVVLAGTGEANSALDSYYGLGMLRSADGGNTWTLISPGQTFNGLGFSKIVFSKENSNLVIAATTGTAQGLIEGSPGSANVGIYFSSDAGVTWARASMTDGIAPASVTSLAYNELTKSFFAAVRYHGFYSSLNGATWTRLPTQPGAGQLDACPTSPASSACPIYRGELSTVPGRDETYAWYVDGNNNDMGIWKSLNGGTSWQPMVDTSIGACGDFSGCGTEDGSYNLSLAAVPDGANPGQTDLYAGAVNLYKCRTTSTSTDCTGTGANTFLNLTHTSGCLPNQGALAHVHPAQHAIDFMRVAADTQVVMYFANDGGVYRSLDGYSGLISGDCATSNSFDNLNLNLGSLTQFVSLAQHPTEANTMMGGAQGAGFPATAQALVNPEWVNVNSGEGGFTAIDSHSGDWFTASNGPNVYKCSLGVSCTAPDFVQVVSSATVEGDAGPFYTPFILDPLDSNSMIAGTCRVWRGRTDGTGFLALSPNLETGSLSGCGGNEINQVRGLAAFQVTDGSFPEIIYAGTDGFGPLVTGGPTGGRLWVSHPSDTTQWADRTGPINPNRFPISAIAIDPFDAQTDPAGSTGGQAAYVAIGGFSRPHVWKTVNGGVSWNDFDIGTLPLVPVNAIVVDSNSPAGTVYAGTDQGVYFRRTNDINGVGWTLLDGGAVGGNLPNVPVTALQIFNSGNTKLLRAATYGRGIWEWVLPTAPDFQISIPSPNQTILARQTATFRGTLSSINGFSDSVALSCSPSCNVSPALISAVDGAVFNVTASRPAGDYALVLTAKGNGTDKTARPTALVMHVVDYSLSKPSPAAITVLRGKAGVPVSFQLSTSGSFGALVSLSCSNPPAGVSCSFSPSSSFRPAGGPVSVGLTISLSSAAPFGTSTVTIDAAALGGHRTQAVAITIVDYVLAPPLPSAMAMRRSDIPTPIALQVNVSGPFSGAVSLNCLDLPAGATCNFSPSSSIHPTETSPVAVDLTISISSTTPAGASIITIDAATLGEHRTRTVSLTVENDPDYRIDADERSLTANVNTPATFNLKVVAMDGYNQPVRLTCGDSAPPTCTFSSSIVIPTVAGALVSVAVGSTQPGKFTFDVQGRSADSQLARSSPSLTFTSLSTTFDFKVDPPSIVQTIKAGDSVQAVFNLNPQPAVTFPSLVTFSQCQGAPPLSTCNVNPLQIDAGIHPTPVTIALTTTAPVLASLPRVHWLYALCIAGLPLLLVTPRSKPARKRLGLLLLLATLTSCGGGLAGNGGGGGAGQPGTQPGPYTVTVTATCAGIRHKMTLTLQVD